MPELPEVETIIRDLRSRILDLRITKVEITLPRIVKNQAAYLKKNLVGNRFINIERTGKLMMFDLAQGRSKLLIHLKMTGQLIYQKEDKIIAGGHDDGQLGAELPGKYTRVILTFCDKSKLFFNDLRTFGYLELANKDRLAEKLINYGVDAFGGKYSLAEFKNFVKNRQTSIKAVLLNQKILAGIGNIYADEILYQAGVKPDRRAGALKTKEIEAIYRAIKPILARAIKFRGTTFNSFVDANGNRGDFSRLLKVYGRAGQKCPACKGIIKKVKVAGRGTHYCPICQK